MKVNKTCKARGELTAPRVDMALRSLLPKTIPLNAAVTFSVRTYEGGDSDISDSNVTFVATWDETDEVEE